MASEHVRPDEGAFNLPALPFDFDDPPLPHAEFEPRYETLVMKGDSMAPEIRPGEVAIIDLDDTTPSPAGLFAVYDGVGIAVKYVEVIPRRLDAKRSAMVWAANPLCRRHEVPLERLNVVGRVVGIIKRT